MLSLAAASPIASACADPATPSEAAAEATAGRGVARPELAEGGGTNTAERKSAVAATAATRVRDRAGAIALGGRC